LALHGLPDVLHVPPGLSGAHLPLVHVPEQHALPDAHAAPSALQEAALHWPLVHARLQQSVLAVHVAPVAWQAPPFGGVPVVVPVSPVVPSSAASPQLLVHAGSVTELSLHAGNATKTTDQSAERREGRIREAYGATFARSRNGHCPYRRHAWSTPTCPRRTIVSRTCAGSVDGQSSV
jgi:hypothetical protein